MTAAGGARSADLGDDLSGDLAAEGLAILGGFHPDPADAAPPGTGTILLVGPDGPGLWARFAAAPERQDGMPDPLDRWTRRVLGGIAARAGARALYPFGGPPWHPFPAWAVRTGTIFVSPVGLLVHHRSGLFVSFRGALALPGRRALPPSAARPCDTCAAPCRTACPVGALTPAGYDVPACRAYLAQPAGSGCSAEGCAVRRACPVGRDSLPPRAQRAFHMAAFGGRQAG